MLEQDLPELIGGKYRPVSVIGVGAMGMVYHVEHILTGEQLALKVMTAHHGATREAIERFKREARASSKIKSEHVVRVIDADVAPELDRAPYLVMDLLDGADLEKASADLPVPPADVVEWMRQIARALDKAHRLGITHRDLKPENLFLSHREDGTAHIKILDFGIAKIAAESTGTTQSGQILGTPLYMSPEQARGDPSQIGPSSDLYALGLIAFKLLTGAPYWKANSVAGIIGQILYEPMPPPATTGCTFGPRFDAWFLRACHRESSQRFTSAFEQVEALAEALGLPVVARGSAHKSNPGAVHESNTGSSLTAVATEQKAKTGDRAGAETLAQSDGTLVSSSRSMPEVRIASGLSGRRKVAILAGAGLLVTVAVLFLLLRGQESRITAAPVHQGGEASAMAIRPPSPSAVPAASVVEAVAEAPRNAPSEPAKVLRSTTVSDNGNGAAGGLTGAAFTATGGKRKEPAKSVTAHTTAVPAPPRSEKLVPNDPLSDQK